METLDVPRLTRAWTLVLAEDEVSAAQQIYALNDGLQWPFYHVVRADVVRADVGDGKLDVNIVAPVWAPDLEGVRKIVDMIQKVAGVTRTQFVVVRVDENRPLHRPFPPHSAFGFIAGEETNPSARPLGFNGWG